MKFGAKSAALTLLLLGSWHAAAATSESLQEGWREIEFLNFDRAISLFEARAGDTDPVGKEARTGLALALHYRQPDRESDKRRAAQLYDALIKDMPDSPSEPADRVVLYLRARMYANVDFPGDKPDPEKAAQLFTRLAGSGKGDLLSELSATHLAAFDLSDREQEKVGQGVEALRKRLADSPGNPLAGAQWMLLGNSFRYPQSDPADAVKAYEEALTAGLAAENLVPSVHWRIARIAESMGNRPAAIDHYRTIAQDHKRALFAHESALALERLKAETNSPVPGKPVE